MGFPVGRCGDILIIFQHYLSFEDGREAWYRRRQRIDYNKIAYVLVVGDEYAREAEIFSYIDCKNKILFTLNWNVNYEGTLSIPVQTPSGVHFMENKSIAKKYYEEKFNVIQWINSL